MGGRGGAQTEETGQAVQTGPDEPHFQQLGPNTAKLDRYQVGWVPRVVTELLSSSVYITRVGSGVDSKNSNNNKQQATTSNKQGGQGGGQKGGNCT